MSEITLQRFANYAEILGATTIITGFILAWLQVRFYRSQQRDRMAISLMQTFQSADLARAVNLIQSLPDNVEAEELRSRGHEYADAATIISTSFETMGLLVYRNIASGDLAMELAGGMATSMYRKLETWLDTIREEQNQPSWAEWFEWFAVNAGKFKATRTPGQRLAKRD